MPTEIALVYNGLSVSDMATPCDPQWLAMYDVKPEPESPAPLPHFQALANSLDTQTMPPPTTPSMHPPGIEYAPWLDGHVGEPVPLPVRTGQLVSPAEELEVLRHFQTEARRFVPCRNAIRSCPIKNFPQIVALHERYCPYNVVLHDRVRGSFCIFEIGRKFRPLCASFEEDFHVTFLVKRDGGGLRFHVIGAGRYTFSIYFISKIYRIFWKYSGNTSDDIFSIPSDLVDKHGPRYRYLIHLQH